VRFCAGDCDTELFAPDLPTLCVGLRGLVYTEIEARREDRSALRRLRRRRAESVLRAHRDHQQAERCEGQGADPRLLRRSAKPTDDELKAWKHLPFNEEDYRKTEVGSNVLTGEPGYSVLYRTWARPTLEVHGMSEGFPGSGREDGDSGQGFGQGFDATGAEPGRRRHPQALHGYVKKLTPKGIKINIKVHSKGPACVVGTDNRLSRGHRSHARDLQERHGVHSLGRLDSHRHRFPGPE
jgi:hypothetical protein